MAAPIPGNTSVGSILAKVRDFVQRNLLEFLGSKVDKDPQNFINEINKIFGVMQMTDNDRVEFASYLVKDVAHIWFTRWKEN